MSTTDERLQKHIFHLEAFVAKFMRILERHVFQSKVLNV